MNSNKVRKGREGNHFVGEEAGREMKGEINWDGGNAVQEHVFHHCVSTQQKSRLYSDCGGSDKTGVGIKVRTGGQRNPFAVLKAGRWTKVA